MFETVALRSGSAQASRCWSALLFCAGAACLNQASRNIPMTFAVLLPTGPSLRNFGLGGFLPKLSEHGDVKVWHNVQGGELRHLASGAGISLERLSPPTENPAASLLRCAMGYAHLFYGRTIAMRQRLRKRPQGRLPE